MQRYKTLLIPLFTALLLPFWVHSQQLTYNTRALSSGTNVHMLWRDMYGNKRSTAFTLPTYDFREGATDFQAYNPATMNTHILSELKKYARTLESRNTEIDVRPSREGVVYAVKSTSQNTIRSIQQQMNYRLEKIQSDYYAQNKLRTYTENGTNYVMPDHSRIAAEYVSKMRPVAAAIKQANKGKGMRDTLNYALNFVQAIPYDTLSSRVSSNGQGFATPYGILKDNKGDCDSKSVMFAAIVKNLYPQVQAAMIYVPEHAFLGLSLPQERNDWALRLGGRPFVLTEPAGPGMVPVGSISSSSRKYLQGKNYTYAQIKF